MTSPWQVEELDLDAYLRRVGAPARPVSRAALDELHTAHVRSFPFENIDILLGQHRGVALPEIAAKFVERGRGGYCFEHSSLFAAVLERLGYDVRRQLGRVGDPLQAPRTHLVVIVTLEGEELLCDPGFGMSIVRPIPLQDGAEDDQDGWRYRVVRRDFDGPAAAGGPTWELHRLRESGWELMHTTDSLPVRPIDVVMGHHHTSTFPGSHFTTGLSLARHGDGRHTTVTLDAVTIRRPGEPTEHRPQRPGELVALLPELGVTLSDEETGRLLTRLTELGWQDPAAAQVS